MKTKVNLSGHPVHPMLVAYPITFYTVCVIAYAVYNWANADLFWFRLGYFCNLAGIGTALLAAIPGLIDWGFGIPKQTPAKRRGLLHASLNVTALILFSISAYLLSGLWESGPGFIGAPFWLALVGLVVTMVAAYHGWEMIATHKMGVNLSPQQERLEENPRLEASKQDIFNPRSI